jgi:hypothetical protein
VSAAYDEGEKSELVKFGSRIFRSARSIVGASEAKSGSSVRLARPGFRLAQPGDEPDRKAAASAGMNPAIAFCAGLRSGHSSGSTLMIEAL